LVLSSIGIHSDDILPVEVFCDVGHEAVLANRDDNIIALEDEAVEIRTKERNVTPRSSHLCSYRCECGVDPAMPLVDVIDVQALALEKERGLRPRAVLRDQEFQFRRAPNDHRAWGEWDAHEAFLANASVSSEPSMSGVIVKFWIAFSLPANS
jgi:hypothetical protein